MKKLDIEILSKHLGIKKHHLKEIICGVRGVSIARALLLEKAAKKVLNKKIPFTKWLLLKNKNNKNK